MSVLDMSESTWGAMSEADRALANFRVMERIALALESIADNGVPIADIYQPAIESLVLAARDSR